jgi:hypothetical protein
MRYPFFAEIIIVPPVVVNAVIECSRDEPFKVLGRERLLRLTGVSTYARD